MIIKATLCTLMIILVAVIAISYYVNKEGFEDITASAVSSSSPLVILEACSDDIWLNIKAKTKDGSIINGAKLVYNSTCKTVDSGSTSDSVLVDNLTIPSTLSTIATVPLTALNEGKSYYLIGPDDTKYEAGSTKLLNGMIYDKNFINKCIMPAAPTAAPTATTAPVAPAAAATVNTLTPTSSSTVTSTTTPQNNLVVPQVGLSAPAQDAASLQQRMELLKDLQQMVKNEIIAQRATEPVVNNSTTSCKASTASDSTAQGKEYANSSLKSSGENCPSNPDGTCPPFPDMSKYIKKDAIPCWGCSLDY
jgi:hypothetical protein